MGWGKKYQWEKVWKWKIKIFNQKLKSNKFSGEKKRKIRSIEKKMRKEKNKGNVEKEKRKQWKNKKTKK